MLTCALFRCSRASKLLAVLNSCRKPARSAGVSVCATLRAADTSAALNLPMHMPKRGTACAGEQRRMRFAVASEALSTSTVWRLLKKAGEFCRKPEHVGGAQSHDKR